MKLILKSLNQSISALFRGRILLLLFIPPLVMIVLLAGVFVYFGPDWADALHRFFRGFTIFAWLQETFSAVDVLAWLSGIFIFLLFVPVAYLGAILVTSIFVVPWVLQTIARTDFATLERKHGGSLLGSLWNTLSAGLLFVILFMATLPFWLLPGMQVIIPLILTSWLNKKVFLYDVLQEFASAEERRVIEKSESLNLYLMGILLAFLNYFPMALFVVPLLSALSYTFYGLNALKKLRRPL